MLNNNSDDDNDMPPPLEDMSAEIKRKRVELLTPLRTKPQTTAATATAVKKTSSDLLGLESKPELGNALSLDSLNLNSTGKKQTSEKPQKKSNEFGGLKGGFFSKAAKPQEKKAPLETLKPTNPAPANSKKQGIVLDEVQEAMKSKLNSTSKEWMTADFLHKIESDAVLAKAFLDPEFQRAIDALTKNPQAAFAHYAQTRPDLIDAMRRFSGILGAQFETLAVKADQDKIKAVPIPEDLPDHEKELLRQVQSDVELQEILKDPKVMQILMTRDQRSPEFQQAIRSKDPIIRRKIEKLVSAGFLRIQ
ncbi:hypothetical protein BDR26DRAFT_855479 [Obelidium mucronatum]|nr:hypothetical protein BDR26DRAFT_855479 [Obelidium mucronatum]